MGCSHGKKSNTGIVEPRAQRQQRQQAQAGPVLLSRPGGIGGGSAGGAAGEGGLRCESDCCDCECEDNCECTSECCGSVTEEQWRKKASQPPVTDEPPLHVRMLTCNLATVAEGAAAVALASTHDVVGLQECPDISKVLIGQGLTKKYTAIRGPHRLTMVYAVADWEALDSGAADVAVDEAEQFQEARAAQWVRLRHRETGKAVFFMNHHGPLRVNSGGRAGGPATGAALVQLAFRNLQPGDAIIVAGDFNAQPGSQTLRELERFVPRVSPGPEYAGLDHVFSALQLVAVERPRASTAVAARFSF